MPFLTEDQSNLEGEFSSTFHNGRVTSREELLDIDMEASIVATTNVTNIADCILELISNSLNAKATSIAIRIQSEKRCIQVIDNGIGIPKIQLKTTAEYNNENISCLNIHNICNWRKRTLINIRKLSNTMIIISRYYNSFKTYMKIFKVDHNPKIVAIERRPSQGTTVSIYGFHELSLNRWNIAFMYHLVGNIAIANPQTSFTIRDNQEEKVTMIIAKLHNPIDIFKVLYDKEIELHNTWCIKSMKKPDIKFCAYIGLTVTKFAATQLIFLNNKLVHCPLILQIVSTTLIDSLKFIGKEQDKQIPKKEEVFILLFITCGEYIFTIENGKRTLIFSNVQDLLQSIRNKILKIFIKDITPLSISDIGYGNKSHKQFEHNERLLIASIAQLLTPVSQNGNSKEDDIPPIPSQWSNWSYPNSLKRSENNSKEFYKHFDFLPEKLHKLLRGNTKLIKTDILNDCGNTCSIKLRSGLQIPDLLPHQEIDVRPCKIIQRYREFKLDRDLLKAVKILGRMNNELIVGLTVKNNTKMLLLMDQHAMHERIRYEQLLYEYKSQFENQLFSVRLRESILVELSVDSCNLLLSKRMILKKFGISFNVINHNTIIIYKVPECLKKSKYYYDKLKLKLNIENLLNELLQKFASCDFHQVDILPLTIHTAIAMEACHGSIRFGDPLTIRECKWLLKLLNKTKNPTRCAHGRPSVIPLLELTNLEKRHKKVVQEKLNFRTIKMYRTKGYIN